MDVKHHVYLLDQGDYNGNSHVDVFCPNKYRSFELTMCLDLNSVLQLMFLADRTLRFLLFEAVLFVVVEFMYLVSF